MREHLDALKPGGGYICGSSHSIVNYIPHENFIAMLNAIHRHGVYGDRAWAGAPRAARRSSRQAGSSGRQGGGLPGTIRFPCHEAHLLELVYRGSQKEIRASIESRAFGKVDPIAILGEALTPAIKAVGSELLLGGHVPSRAPDGVGRHAGGHEGLSPYFYGRTESARRAKVLLGTIKGDLHDIGKNIVRALLEGNGFEVVDIGIDNAPEKFVDAAGGAPRTSSVTRVSSRRPSAECRTRSRRSGRRVSGRRRITIVGGAPVTKDFAERNGVDLFGKDANEGVLAIEKALAARKR